MKKSTHNCALSLNDSTYSVSPRIFLDSKNSLLMGRPFAYLLGFSEFYKRKFFINEDVLIPRGETELMVDLIVRSNRRFNSALDVGTGSGVIILSLLSEGVVQRGMGCDLSDSALRVARINAHKLRLGARCEFVLSDKLEKVEGKFDLIVSNPPYIKNLGHRKMVHHQVDKFEPHLALYLEDAEYESWFQSFFEQVDEALLPRGVFVMEGHEAELKKQALQLQTIGFKNIEVLSDYSGADRFLRSEKRM